MGDPTTSTEALKAVLQNLPDDDLARFLAAYSLGSIAELLIDRMVPAGRAAWFAEMRLRYPEAFVESLLS